MTFKVLLTIFALFATFANADDGKYTLNYLKTNKWVAQEDLKPLRDAIIFFQNNNLKIKAICSNQEQFCDERIAIINHIFERQKVQQKISVIENSTTVPFNKLVLESINLDKNKYANLIINYENKKIISVEKSQTDFTKLLKYAETKYLSQFKMYCNDVNELCKNRFNQLNDILAKTLKFKYNFALYTSQNLEQNEVQITASRHDYIINKPISEPVTTAKQEVAKKVVENKDANINYTQDQNIIVFKDESSELLLLEKVKVENLIAKSLTNKFNFACGTTNLELCQARVHAIKNYALKNTSNIIIMDEVKQKIDSNYVLVVHK
jgi:hypothetical protein